MAQMVLDNNQEVFFELLRAGLWEKEARLSQFDNIDYTTILQLAEEQSVVGLVTAGFEHVLDVKVPQEWVLQFVGETLQIEQQNKAMNVFLALLIEKLRKADVYTLLLKGQGIAQCYERPLWRTSGDVDFFLSEDNYRKAKTYLQGIGVQAESELKAQQDISFSIEQWLVELHGSLRCGLSSRMDRELDQIRIDTFYGGAVRSWLNGGASVFLLEQSNDAVYVFAHFFKHFYRGGIGLRQICDWCRILWTYRETINRQSLEKRICNMGLESEWKAFAAFAVEYLGMPKDAMPLYDPADKWKRKAKKICPFIMEVGNFGHNRDTSYFEKYPYVIRKLISLGRRIGDLYRHARMFPMDSFRFFPYMFYNGIRSALRGE